MVVGPGCTPTRGLTSQPRWGESSMKLLTKDEHVEKWSYVNFRAHVRNGVGEVPWSMVPRPLMKYVIMKAFFVAFLLSPWRAGLYWRIFDINSVGCLIFTNSSKSYTYLTRKRWIKIVPRSIFRSRKVQMLNAESIAFQLQKNRFDCKSNMTLSSSRI
jgi:hypothetical protein